MRLILPLMCALIITCAAASHAQMAYVNTQDLTARLERLEQRLAALEEKIFTSNNSINAERVADHEIRLQEMERESSQLYGKIEEVGKTLNVLSQKLDMLTNDLTFRLEELEELAAQGGQQSFQPQQQTAEAKTTQDSTRAQDQEKVNQIIQRPESFKVPKDIEPKVHYRKAYELLTTAQYGAAYAWLEAFLERHPEHDLADNAYYWLGEVHLVEDRPQAAAKSFKDGLEAFPESPKAPGSLLKLGVAFDRLAKPGFATATWRRLVEQFPDSPEAERARGLLETITPADAVSPTQDESDA